MNRVRDQPGIDLNVVFRPSCSTTTVRISDFQKASDTQKAQTRAKQELEDQKPARIPPCRTGKQEDVSSPSFLLPSMSSSSPPHQRVKLESPSPPPETQDEDEDNCSICLQPLVDRTVVPTCSHEFCFDCLVVWTGQSRKCPLCAQMIGEYLIHRIRSRYDYQKHYLAPNSKPGLLPLRAASQREPDVRRRRRRREWRRRDQDEADNLERSIEKPRLQYVYEVPAVPHPAQFAASQEMVSKTTMFLRRELGVWDNLDVEFFTTFTISLMKSIDIRSESAVKLLAEFLDIDTGGRVMEEHFVHASSSNLTSMTCLPMSTLSQCEQSVIPFSSTSTIPGDVDAPASITDIIEPPRPADVKGKSRASDEPLGDTPSIVGLQPDVKGKSRGDTPRLSPTPSNLPETACAQSKKPVRTVLDSLRAHLSAASASSSSSPALLNRLSSRNEDKTRVNNSSDAPDSQSSSDRDQSSAEKKEAC
ncbi:uncharacterized protein EV420DRAFT_1486225 [Desarmillaria tabescens]|uniref:RING-type E3 ubiquitin transferase n=1 Tax=Armillaria tabescens TaxID=1929756 RepID=A0AA39JBH5_ARMTA|nr:uncharacterized protein EV420DRAFT_1486225 [Desarmillaria tabescens]KAK0439702.1 hypothetical protein EV420DRAFT_1486225 [Desarmillaria tabescens]